MTLGTLSQGILGSAYAAFTSSATWVVPTNVTKVRIRAVAGGGGGGGGGAGANTVAAGSGAGGAGGVGATGQVELWW